MDSPRIARHPRPWLFAAISAPYGCFNGLVAVALPFILRQRGLSVGRIASIEALVQAPAIWYFLWAAMVDVKLRRRTWVMVLSVASALCAGIGLAYEDARSVRSMTVLLVLASMLNQPVSSAAGGLVGAVMPNALRGRTAGWSQAGILGGGILTGGLCVWLTGVTGAGVLALVAAALIVVPAFAAVLVDEPPASREPLVAHLGVVWRDVRRVLGRRDVWRGFVFFVSPIGAAALSNLFSAVAADFHASPRAVIVVVVLAGVLTPLGALVGGALCDRYDRWRLYPIAGLCSAASACVMLVAPLTPATYIAGAALYAFTTGFAYAAFMALAFALLGVGGSASGTRFSLFMAAVNVPVVYMIRLDGFAHTHFGVHGMLAVDAASNALFAVVFLCWALRD